MRSKIVPAAGRDRLRRLVLALRELARCAACTPGARTRARTAPRTRARRRRAAGGSAGSPACRAIGEASVAPTVGEVDVADRGRVGLDEPVLACARAAWIRGEASAAESCDWSAAFSARSFGALCVRAVEPEVQPQHGEVDEDDPGEQDAADRRSRAIAAARAGAARARAGAGCGASRARLRPGLGAGFAPVAAGAVTAWRRHRGRRGC